MLYYEEEFFDRTKMRTTAEQFVKFDDILKKKYITEKNKFNPDLQ